MSEYTTDHERDVVVDTNVLAASENSTMPAHTEALDFLVWFAADEELYWTLDDNGKRRPILETSTLWAEYNETLNPVGTAMLLFTQLSARQRVVFSPRPNQNVRAKISRLVPDNQKDRVVLGAAATSKSRWLVSEDYHDFPDSVRKKCRQQLGVQVTGAEHRAA